MGMLLPGRALVVSLGLHLALGYGAFERASTAPRPPRAPAPDVWAGNAVEVESVTLKSSEPEAAPAPDDVTPQAPKAEVQAESPEPEQTTEAEPDVSAAPVTSLPRPVPKPRAAPKPREMPPAASARETLPASAASSAFVSAADVRAGSFGGEGLPQGVRALPKAFARALPQASKADGGWHELELGKVAPFEVALTVDEQGKLGELAYPGPSGKPALAVLRRMLERTLLLLRSGTFSLAEDARKSGTQRLKLEVEVSAVAVSEDEFAEPEHARQHGRVPGHETPSLERPARCFWIYNSGRRVDVRVWLVR